MYLIRLMTDNILIYAIKWIIKKFNLLWDGFIRNINILYEIEYPFYQMMMHIFFIFLLLTIAIILYWDHVYKSAKKSSVCSNIINIINDNVNSEKPFVYNIMIINKDHINYNLNKFALIFVFDFVKKTTKIIDGDDKYYDAIKYISDKKDNPNKFNYYDLSSDKNKVIGISNNVFTGNDYLYIPVDSKNKKINNDAAYKLADFVRNYAQDINTNKHIINEILSAVDQTKTMSIYVL